MPTLPPLVGLAISVSVRPHLAPTGVTWLLSAVAAFGQVNAPLNITSEEEAKLYSTLSQGSLRNHDPVGFALPVGAKVPAAVEVYEVPEAVPAPVQGYRYMVHSGRVYIVDPSTREVVRVIPNR